MPAAGRRILKALLVGAAPALMAAAILSASVSASAQPSGTAGALRIGTTGASWQTDPALAYINSSWELEYRQNAPAVIKVRIVVGSTVIMRLLE